MTRSLTIALSSSVLCAAALCVYAAYRAGAGMVRLGVPGADPAHLPQGEAVASALPGDGWSGAALAMAERCRALVIGPGLGRAPGVAAEVRRLVAEAKIPVVVDADALVALGDVASARAVVGSRGSSVVLTPHDGELARMAGAVAGDDRIAAARQLSGGTGAVVLLKGATTAVATPEPYLLAGPAASPDARARPGPTVDVLVSVTGTPRLATAGTGDVLSGMIGAFAARGAPLPLAAALAAHVHGRAAELGRVVGLVAGDVPRLASRWLSEHADG